MIILKLKFTLLIACGLVFSFAVGRTTADPSPPPPVPFQETVTPLGQSISGEEIFSQSITISPDKKHLAYVSRISNFYRVWHDGAAETTYQGITQDSPFFSPKKNRLAYIALEDDQMYAVIDHQHQEKYAKVGDVTFSPDGSRFAYRAESDDGKQLVVVDGKKGPSFEVGVPHNVGIVFSPDSTRVAYVGIERDGSQTFVLDHKKVSNYDEIAQILFSPDSRHYALICRLKENRLVVKDGKRGRRYQKVGNLVFSPDSRHIAYAARKSRRMIVVKNNQEYDRGRGTALPVFSPDGSRFAYLTMDKDGNARFIIDDNRGPVIGRPGKLIFSRDSSRFAYGAWIGGKWHVIIDGEKGPAFKEISAFAFSPYTNDLVYIAETGDGVKHLVVNNVVSKPYKALGTPVFSPDGETMAFVAMDEDKMFMVIDNHEGKRYPVIGTPDLDAEGRLVFSFQQPFFSPDGSRLAYPVFLKEDQQAFMVVDGKEHPSFETISRPYFSPDGRSVVYTARRDDERLMVVDGKEHPSFEAISRPYFSPDGRSVVYTARRDDKTLIVVDGHPGQARFDGLLQGAEIRFETDNRFYLLLARQDDPGPFFFRLEVEIDDRPGQ